MKLKAYQVEGFLNAPDPAVRVALFYGPDRGAVRENARRLAAQFLGDGPDPMQLVELSAEQLSHQPNLLFDEAAAIPMFGGNKVVMTQAQGERLTKMLKSYFDSPAESALVIVEAGNLAPAAALRKAFEAADCAMALPCFEDNPKDIQRLAKAHLEQEGFRVEAAALEYLSQYLGADRGVTRQELNRLVLYMGPQGSSARTQGDPVMITYDDVAEIIGDSAVASLDGLVDAVALGRLEQADKALSRLAQSGTPAPAALGRLRQHFQNLHLAQGLISNGKRVQDALQAAFRPPLNFKRKPLVENQLALWPKAKTATALSILHDSETACRQTGTPEIALASYTLLRLARAARR
jgi:DNA polymerase-3 subunit delta